MGPLVPDYVTNELNLIVALLVGIAFGYILEQAGFSSSRKLTGLFYGTDFTVLRVFFTAGLSAMTGVLLLSKLGYLDASVVYVNPTFVYAALLGGAIMGVGFVIGGYCPGTSFCAAAVGRIDGMAFVGGGLAGVLAFGEAFPHIRRFYEAGALGDVTVPALLDIAPGTFAVAMIAVAIAAFAIAGRLETRINPESPLRTFHAGRHRIAAVGLLAFGMIAAAVPDYKQRLLATAADDRYRLAHPIERMTADELAFRIVDADPALLIVDVRPAVNFEKGSLPGSVNVVPDDLFGRSAPAALAQAHRRKVFVAEIERQADEAATAARLLGYDNVAVLEGGLGRFRSEILDAALPGAVPATANGDLHAFRVDAGRQIATLMKARGSRPTADRRPKKIIVGGCGV